MNERLEKLAQQAGLEVTSNDHYEYDWFDPAKFAELIIRECGKVAWHLTPETEELEYSHLIKDKILEHFGVKE